MLIVGAGGLAREILETLLLSGYIDDLYFFDDVHPDRLSIYGTYPVLKNREEVKAVFLSNTSFTLALGDGHAREILYYDFVNLGGAPLSVISPKAVIGVQNIVVGQGSYIAHGAVLTTNIHIGAGCLINPNCTVGHDVEIGEFVTLSPGVHITGHCKIGKGCTLGTGAVILPGLEIGEGAIIGAGSVVTKNIPDGCTVIGVPGRITKRNHLE